MRLDIEKNTDMEKINNLLLHNNRKLRTIINMTNNNKNNIDQQNNNASNIDDFVFNPKSTILEPKRKLGDDVNIEKTDFKDYDSILKRLLS